MGMPASTPLAFDVMARLPFRQDNAAVSSLRVEAGQEVMFGDRLLQISHSVLEGHRFAVRAIQKGEHLLSWGLPFGKALRDIEAGAFLCNARMLETLKGREVKVTLPEQPNFSDHMQVCQIDSTFKPGQQVAPAQSKGSFMGFARGPKRGVGVRNHIVILAVSSQANAYAHLLCKRFEQAHVNAENMDPVVAVQHTEGGDREAPANNQEMLLRTLGGFMVHPNVGAVLVVDHLEAAINQSQLKAWIRQNQLPLEDVPHAFITLSDRFETAMRQGEKHIKAWIPQLCNQRRSAAPLSALKVALQCGGSDSFSGLSGNPLAGWVAKELIRHGGAAVLAETDELIGAEPYILSNVRDQATATQFLSKIAQFKQRAAWHGHSAEGNPSGGNLMRGLYNIALKSLGAARKKDPKVRLDYVIDYAEPMGDSGYYFMDSPGNDLESIAGQVASGSQIILFITGNGSITNFPFAPTLKFVTTSGRFKMLSHEMDVNAGRHQDGERLEDLGQEVFEQFCGIANGKRSLGDQAGHYQVSIWRNWHHSKQAPYKHILNAPKPSAKPLLTIPTTQPLQAHFEGFASGEKVSIDQVALIVPTSLCSGQVARLAAESLNQNNPAPKHVSRYVSLVHTEGCGAAPGYSEEMYLRTMLGHLRHPMVKKALLLEHGCEKTHNDAMRLHLKQQGVNPAHFGFASVQLDGGLDRVMAKIRAWFADALEKTPHLARSTQHFGTMCLGLTSTGTLESTPAKAMASIAAGAVALGGTVVIPENACLLRNHVFCEALFPNPQACQPSLSYGEYAKVAGLHIMETPTRHSVETLTGLGGCGVQVMAAHLNGAPLQAHPMIPLVQISSVAKVQARFGADLDCTPSAQSGVEAMRMAMLDSICEAASGVALPKLFVQGNVDFQLTRGLLGFSL